MMDVGGLDLDVGWMTHGTPKDKANDKTAKTAAAQPPAAPHPPPSPPRSASAGPISTSAPPASRSEQSRQPVSAISAHDPLQIPAHEAPPPPPASTRRSTFRGGLMPSSAGPDGQGPTQRRASWFSSMASRFAGSGAGTNTNTANNHNNNSNNSNSANSPSKPQQQQQQNQQQQQQQQQQQPPPPHQHQHNHQHNQPPHNDPLSSRYMSANIPPSPKPAPAAGRSAILQPGVKAEGEAPYTPAPPKSNQAGFFGVLRRFSSAGGGIGSTVKSGNHGLVERRTLNVDRERERCPISELADARLRKVSFCVDVEIAPMPRYADSDEPTADAKAEKRKRKMERGEAAALKHPRAVEEQKETEGVIRITGERVPKEPEKEGISASSDMVNGSGAAAAAASSSSALSAANVSAKPTTPPAPAPEKEKSKKKEKKKKSEEERRARKERKRKLAEASGTIPMEIHYDGGSDSSSRPSTPSSDVGARTPVAAGAAAATASLPTTNPVRIYRRCCQLRESEILTSITDQVADPANVSAEAVLVVNKLDLSGYWLRLEDLRTLGDYLAVVPVRELVLENCGMSDEGLRCVLAGLLAAKQPSSKQRRRRSSTAATRESRIRSSSSSGGGGGGGGGGVVERLVLSHNDIGIDGWKSICLFIYMCRSVKYLDLSGIAFPQQQQQHSQPQPQPSQKRQRQHQPSSQPSSVAVASLLSRCLAERLAGSTLELLNLGETRPAADQLRLILDGVIGSGLARLGLANNGLDARGLEYLARYLRHGKCEGLDLSGNDLGGNMGPIAAAIDKNHPLWALSLADCGLKPADMAVLFPALPGLPRFRFLDLSHNQDLCRAEPSAIPLFRKYLPQLHGLKRIHLANVDMSLEQAISIIEILPDISHLSYIKLLANPSLVALADAQTANGQEEACALYASLLTATRLSRSIVCIDMEVPTEASADPVKAMAKQVIAYCLRNLERTGVAIDDDDADRDDDGAADRFQGAAPQLQQQIGTPGVMSDLVNAHEHEHGVDGAADDDQEPDDAYMIGGTGVAKALTCCLQSSRLGEEDESGFVGAPPGKARELSKQLLASARKIRARIGPALARTRADPDAVDQHHVRRLLFLDQTLQGIIHRFEDEFPETRLLGEEHVSGPGAEKKAGSSAASSLSSSSSSSSSSPSSRNHVGTVFPPETAAAAAGGGGGGEDHADARSPASANLNTPANTQDMVVIRPLSRSNSVLSQTSRAHIEEEGRAHRVSQQFRAGIAAGLTLDDLLPRDLQDMSVADPRLTRLLDDLLDDLCGAGSGDAIDQELRAAKAEKGAVRTVIEHRESVLRRLREADPEHWRLLLESQEKARENTRATRGGGDMASVEPLQDQQAPPDDERGGIGRSGGGRGESAAEGESGRSESDGEMEREGSGI